MVNYQNGQIYRIVDNAYSKCYIGSTCEDIRKRFTRHKEHYIEFKKGKANRRFCTSYYLFDEFGVENCKVEWIEDYPCSCRKELEKQEGYYQKNTECVNKYIAGRTYQEWAEDNKEHLKMYQSEYSKNNPEKRMLRNATVFECDCGLTYTYGHKARHFKSNKHQQYLQNQTNPQE